MSFKYEENFSIYFLTARREDLSKRPRDIIENRKKILALKKENEKAIFFTDHSDFRNADPIVTRSFLMPTLLIYYYKGEVYATKNENEIARICDNNLYLGGLDVKTNVVNYFEGTKNITEEVVDILTGSKTDVPTGETIELRYNHEKRIHFNLDNLKIVNITSKVKKLNASWTWKFFNFYEHHWHNRMKPKTILIVQQSENECATNCIQYAFTRLGYYLTPYLTGCPRKQKGKTAVITKFLNKDMRLYIRDQILIIPWILMNNDFDVFMNFTVGNIPLTTIKQNPKESDLLELIKNGFDMDYISQYFEHFALQNIKKDVVIIINVFSSLEAESGHYVTFYYPRSPAKLGEIYDSLNTEGNVSKYQYLHNLFKKMIILIQKRHFEEHYRRYFFSNWNPKTKKPEKFLSYRNLKKPVINEENLLDCDLDYDNYLLNHSYGYESFIQTDNSSIFMNPYLYEFLKHEHEKPHIHQNIDDIATIELGGNYGKIIISSWKGSANYMMTKIEDISKNLIRRVSLLSNDDINKFDETEKESYNLMVEINPNFDNIEIPDHTELDINPPISKTSFIHFFKIISQSEHFLKSSKNHVLVVHCKSGIGRANLFVSMLLYYIKSTEIIHHHPYQHSRYRKESFDQYRFIYEEIKKVRPQMNVHKRMYPFISYVIENIYRCKYTNFFE